MKPISKLNRFTSLPVLLDLLSTKELVLINPSSWDDKNDTELIKIYKEKAKFKTLLALCFTFSNETVHHWKKYANGSSGCCIEFDGEKLIDIFKKLKDKFNDSNVEKLRHGIVKYKRIKDIPMTKFPLSRMPFYKRSVYGCESEYRVIWCGKEHRDCYEIKIPLEIIRKITLNQDMPERVFQSVKRLLNEMIPTAIINQSTLINNKDWIDCFKEK